MIMKREGKIRFAGSVGERKGFVAETGSILPELPADAAEKVYKLKSVNGVQQWVEPVIDNTD